MKINMGSTDRVIRLILAVFIGILFVTGIIGGTSGIVLLVVAGILLITTITGFCGLYRLLGINTCRLKAGKKGRGTEQEPAP